MCGILGLIHNYNNPFSIEEFSNLNRLNINRGPDANSVINFDINDIQLKIGHTRLSIQDLSNNANQPMTSFTGRFIISFNGEIYNHHELRKNLNEKFNIKWRSTSDTETLLNMFEFYDYEDVLNMINGMFAFIIYDKKTNTIIVARDAAGEKPLYINFDKKHIMISSDLNCIKSFTYFEKSISNIALKKYLELNYIPSPLSIFENVFKLPASSLMKIDLNKFKFKLFKNFENLIVDNGIEFSKWWSINLNKNNYKNHNYKEIYDLVKDNLKSSIKSQLISDVPLGAFLSGGIDSSLIVSIMQRLQKQTKTFTIGFENKEYDESNDANKIANYLSTDHTNYVFSNLDFLKFIESSPAAFSEPFADSSQLPTLLVSQLAKDNVKVVLTGDGGDELFGGYNRYIYANKYWKLFNFMNPKLRNLFFKIIINYQPNLFIKILNNFTNLKITKQSMIKISNRFKNITNEYSYYKSLTNEWTELDDILRDNISNDDDERIKNLFTNKSLTFEEKMMLTDFETYLTDDILCKVDRSTMFYGIESRAPFLNKDLINLAFNLPLSYKLNNGYSKIILKDILSEYLPNNLINKSKKGFGIPIGQFIRNDLKEWSYDILSKEQCDKHNFFNFEVIKKTLNDHIKNNVNNQYKLWSIIQFNLWYDKLNC